MDREKVIAKIKLLQKLMESPNENESANAKALADSLIEKHGIQPSELKDNTFQYPEENILYRSHVRSVWKTRLAIVLSTQFYCYVIEQKLTSLMNVDNNEVAVDEFVYFIYGDDADVANVKRLYLTLEAKIDAVIQANCKSTVGPFGRPKSDLFEESFSEGLMNAIKYRIENGDFDFKIQDLKEEKLEKSEAIVKPSATNFPDKKPVENKRDIAEDKKPIDILAYFKGEKAGMNLELEDLLKEKETLDLAGLFDSPDVESDDWDL